MDLLSSLFFSFQILRPFERLNFFFCLSACLLANYPRKQAFFRSLLAGKQQFSRIDRRLLSLVCLARSSIEDDGGERELSFFFASALDRIRLNLDPSGQQQVAAFVACGCFAAAECAMKLEILNKHTRRTERPSRGLQ